MTLDCRVVSHAVKSHFSELLVSNIILTSLSAGSVPILCGTLGTYLYIGITLSDYNIAFRVGFDKLGYCINFYAICCKEWRFRQLHFVYY